MDEFYYKVVELGQGAYDLAIQEYGSIEAVFMVLEDNPGIDMTENIELGTEVRFRYNPPVDVVTDGETMNFLRRNEIRVNNMEHL
jgi:hypothetical protein